ncbi:MAG: CopG family transcriptional regulator [Chloroflexi bacterium]|nr:CopG family transcriptional regulator [Chloroflexota bacterium]MBI2983694.1 CopG family transcriptional regulator [Chloroflexota bacterium]
MIRKQVQFTERQAARVRREAARRGISESAVIREAVDRGLGGRSGPTDEQWEAALSVAGIARSDVPDLAREHDRYYAEDLERDLREKREEWERLRGRPR